MKEKNMSSITRDMDLVMSRGILISDQILQYVVIFMGTFNNIKI